MTPRRNAAADSRTAHRTARAGFTLVEVMVAMLIFTIGLLGLATTSAVVVRQMGDAGRMGVAAAVAEARMEKLRVANCKTAVASASDTVRTVISTWSVTPQTRSTRIDVTVTYVTRNGSRSQSYRSTVPCF
jgi:type IV pilus assembly protein PilV